MGVVSLIFSDDVVCDVSSAATRFNDELFSWFKLAIGQTFILDLLPLKIFFLSSSAHRLTEAHRPAVRFLALTSSSHRLTEAHRPAVIVLSLTSSAARSM